MASRLFSQDYKNPFGAGSWHTEQWGALPSNQNPFLWLICEESKFLYHLVKGFLSSKYNNHFNIVISHYETNLLGPVQFAGWEQGTEYSAEIRTEQTTDQCFPQSKAARTNKQSKDRWTQQLPSRTRTSDLTYWKKFRFIAFLAVSTYSSHQYFSLIFCTKRVFFALTGAFKLHFQNSWYDETY